MSCTLGKSPKLRFVDRFPVGVMVTLSPSERRRGFNPDQVWQAELATGMTHFSIKWQGSLNIAIDARKET